MEILNYTKDVPAIVLIPLLFIILGACALIWAFIWAYTESEWDGTTIATAIISCIVLVFGIVWISTIKENVYVFARMTDEKAFTEMVKDYDFIEEVAGIYKLRLK